MSVRLAGERRLVHVQLQGFEQLAVGWHLFACLQDDDVAHHDVAPWHLAYIVIAKHLHRRVVVNLVQALEGFLVAAFQEECHPGGQQQGDDDAHRLEEDRQTGSAPFVLVNRDAHRQHEGGDENAEKRVVECSEEPHEEDEQQRNKQHGWHHPGGGTHAVLP